MAQIIDLEEVAKTVAPAKHIIEPRASEISLFAVSEALRTVTRRLRHELHTSQPARCGPL